VQHVEAHGVLPTRGVDHHGPDVFLLGEQRQQVGWHDLDQVDLAVDQGVHLGLGVGDRHPLDAVDLGYLAAGQS
jgi:hypothetical protein